MTTYPKVEDVPTDADGSGEGDDNENYAYVSKEEKAAQEHIIHSGHDYDFEHLEALWSEDGDVYCLLDMGATRSVAGTEWLQRLKCVLANHGLRPIIRPAAEAFHGLGGVQKKAT